MPVRPLLPARRARGVAARAAGAVALLLGTALLTAAPAAAHDELVATTPVGGARLTASPAEVVLTFGEDVTPLGTAVVVTDAAGARLSDGKPVVAGGVVTQALLPATVAGRVIAAYRIVSTDGHPVSGRIMFTVPAPSASPSVLPPSASPTTVPPSGGASSSPPATSSAPATLADDEETSSGAGALPWVIGIAVLAVLLGALLVSRRRREGGSTS